MNIRVEVNGMQFQWERSAEPDIVAALDRTRRAGVQTCVKVMFADGPRMTLATACCPALHGGSRLNDLQMDAYELWRRLGLSDEGCQFPSGRLIEFLKRVDP